MGSNECLLGCVIGRIDHLGRSDDRQLSLVLLGEGPMEVLFQLCSVGGKSKEKRKPHIGQ